jgi:hypothetical protein
MAINRLSLLASPDLDTTAAWTLSTPIAAGTIGNRILVVSIHFEQGGVDAITGNPTWNAVNLVELLSTFHNTWSQICIFYLLEASLSTTTANISVPHVAGTPRGRIVAQLFEGVDQATPFRTTQRTTNNGSQSGTSSTQTVPSVATGDYLLDALTVDAGSHNLTAGANQTEDYDDDVLSSCATGGSRQAGVDGGVMSWTWTTAAPYSQISTALIPAASGTIYTDSDTVIVTLTPSATENREILDANTVPLALTPSATESREISDAATVSVALTPSGAEARESTDTNTVVLAITPSAVELKAKEYTDADTVTLTITPSSVENAQDVDATTVPVVITPSGVDIQAGTTTDAGTIPLAITPSSTQVFDAVDAATVYVDLQTSGTENRESADSSTVPVALTPSGTESREVTDTNTIYVDLQLSSAENRESTDASTVPFTITPSGVDTLTSGFVDADTVRLTLTPSATQAFAGVDASTAYVTITPSASEVYTSASMVDAATVYVTITPGLFIEVFIPFDSLLVGTLTRHWSAALSDNRFSATLAGRRFGAAMMGTRFSAALSKRWSAILGRK